MHSPAFRDYKDFLKDNIFNNFCIKKNHKLMIFFSFSINIFFFIFYEIIKAPIFREQRLVGSESE
jgi:hypothetical protein